MTTANETPLMLLVVAFVILPLSLIRELSALRFISILAVFSMVHPLN